MSRLTLFIAALFVFGALPLAAQTDASLASARALFDAGQYDAAAEQLQKVIQTQPGRASAHNLLGRVEMRRGDPAQAALHFSEAVRLAPGEAWYWNNLGYALLESGQPAEAIAPLQRAAELRSGDPTILGNLATAQERSGLPAVPRIAVAPPPLPSAPRLDAPPPALLNPPSPIPIATPDFASPTVIRATPLQAPAPPPASAVPFGRAPGPDTGSAAARGGPMTN